MMTYTFQGEIFRRIGYMKHYMQESLTTEEFAELSADGKETIRERVTGYSAAIDDVLTVLAQLRLP